LITMTNVSWDGRRYIVTVDGAIRGTFPTQRLALSYLNSIT